MRSCPLFAFLGGDRTYRFIAEEVDLGQKRVERQGFRQVAEGLGFGDLACHGPVVRLEGPGKQPKDDGPVPRGEKAGAWYECNEEFVVGAVLEVILLVVLVLEFFSFFGDDAGGVGYAESSQEVRMEESPTLEPTFKSQFCEEMVC